VDTIADQVERAYAGWPDRMYILDPVGKIIYKGDEGPRGFKPSLEQAPTILDRLLVGEGGPPLPVPSGKKSAQRQ
jgi:hypothetical protein